MQRSIYYNAFINFDNLFVKEILLLEQNTRLKFNFSYEVDNSFRKDYKTLFNEFLAYSKSIEDSYDYYTMMNQYLKSLEEYRKKYDSPNNHKKETSLILETIKKHNKNKKNRDYLFIYSPIWFCDLHPLLLHDMFSNIEYMLNKSSRPFKKIYIYGSDKIYLYNYERRTYYPQENLTKMTERIKTETITNSLKA